MSTLVLDDVSKQYGSQAENLAVSHVSFQVHHGEFVALLGPSGCGKSTTLRMIAGLEQISSGRISLDDQSINELSPDRRNIGMAFETYSLYPPLTIFDNIAYNLKAKRVPADEIRKRVNDVARVLGITELLEWKPGKLSGGQKQRVNLARAIVRNPALLLLDEPLSHLDTVERRVLRRELKRIHHQTKLTTVLVTHDQSEAMALANRIVVLNNGVVQQSASVTDIYRYPENLFVAAFIGEPSMNFVEGIVTQRGIQLMDETDTWVTGSDGIAPEPVVIGIRPSDVMFMDSKNSSHLKNGVGRVEGTIISVEYLGDETHTVISWATPTNPLIRVTDAPRWSISVGDKIHAYVKRFHVFSKQSGARLATIENHRGGQLSLEPLAGTAEH